MSFRLDGFPRADPEVGRLIPVKGAVLPANSDSREKGHEIFMGFRVDQADGGRSTRTHIRVTYRYQGRTYTDEWTDTFAVCKPKKGPECRQEYADSGFS
jgi:hypothetical protein